MKLFNRVIFFVALLASVDFASAQVQLFQDNFSTFSLGTTWQAGPEGLAPDVRLGVTSNAGRSVLDMASSYGGQIKRVGIQTITPISTASLTSLTADVVFTSISGTNVSLEFDFLGNVTGDNGYRWFIQPFLGYGLSWDHSNNPVYTTSVGTYYDVSLTLDSTGSHLVLKDSSENVLATADYAPNTLSTLGSNFTVALDQTTGGNQPEAYVDSITVTGMPEPTPGALIAACAAALIGFTRFLRHSSALHDKFGHSSRV